MFLVRRISVKNAEYFLVARKIFFATRHDFLGNPQIFPDISTILWEAHKIFSIRAQICGMRTKFSGHQHNFSGRAHNF
jgi:hypothetical protein